MYEKRLTQRLTRYWDTLKKEETMPPFQKFNPSAIDDIWDHCLLLAVNDNNPDKLSYSYYRMGDKVKGLYKGDVIGQTVNPKMKGSQGAGIVKKVGEVLENPEPFYDNGQFINGNNKVVKFRSCMLPFGSNGHVTHVIVGLSWREFG